MNRKSSCYPLDLLIANIALACIDGALASIAFSQVLSCFSSSFLCILPLLCIILDGIGIHNLGLVDNWNK